MPHLRGGSLRVTAMESVFQWKKGFVDTFFRKFLLANSLIFRCDQFPNCEDFSDEANCKLVVLPANYVIDYAPFTVDERGELMKVQVQIKVGEIQSKSFIQKYDLLLFRLI